MKYYEILQPFLRPAGVFLLLTDPVKEYAVVSISSRENDRNARRQFRPLCDMWRAFLVAEMDIIRPNLIIALGQAVYEAIVDAGLGGRYRIEIVRHPAQGGAVLAKEQIRRLARELGLPERDKPIKNGAGRPAVGARTASDHSAPNRPGGPDQGHDCGRAGIRGAYARFFEALVKELARPDRLRNVRYDSSENSRTTNGINIFDATLPRPGNTRYAFVFGEDGKVRAELYIDTRDRERNKRLFDALKKNQEAVEAEFGEPLSWQRRDDGNGSRVAIYVTGSITDDDERLQQIKTWAIDRLLKLKQVFSRRLEQLGSL